MDEAEREDEGRSAELEDGGEAPQPLFDFGGPPPLESIDEIRDKLLRSRQAPADDDESNTSDASVASLGRRMRAFGGRSGGSSSESASVCGSGSAQRGRKRKSGSSGRRSAPKRPRRVPRGRDEVDDLHAELRGAPAAPVPVMAGDVPGSEDKKEPEPWPADVVDWDDVDDGEIERNPDPAWCALCRHTQRTIDVGENNPYIPDLVKLAEDSWVHTDTIELTRQLQAMYNKEIRPFIEQVDQRLPWHKKTIFYHFTRHTKSSRIKFEVVAEAIDEAVEVILKNELFVKNPKTGKKNINAKRVSQFFKFLDKQERYDKMLKTMRPHNVL